MFRFWVKKSCKTFELQLLGCCALNLKERAKIYIIHWAEKLDLGVFCSAQIQLCLCCDWCPLSQYRFLCELNGAANDDLHPTCDLHKVTLLSSDIHQYVYINIYKQLFQKFFEQHKLHTRPIHFRNCTNTGFWLRSCTRDQWHRAFRYQAILSPLGIGRYQATLLFYERVRSCTLFAEAFVRG